MKLLLDIASESCGVNLLAVAGCGVPLHHHREEQHQQLLFLYTSYDYDGICCALRKYQNFTFKNFFYII